MLNPEFHHSRYINNPRLSKLFNNYRVMLYWLKSFLGISLPSIRFRIQDNFLDFPNPGIQIFLRHLKVFSLGFPFSHTFKSLFNHIFPAGQPIQVSITFLFLPGNPGHLFNIVFQYTHDLLSPRRFRTFPATCSS